MTDHQQDKQQPRSQQELQMGEQAPQPGERAEDEQQEQSYGSTSQGPEQQRTPMAEGSEGYEGPSSGQPGRS